MAERKAQQVLQQFQALSERANKRFNKLREQQEEHHAQAWPGLAQSYHKVFACFNELWRFQLENRPALLEAGLQRVELGSIASKIGQLYYNYYLRSADTGALLESYIFYDAIHSRQYFGIDTPQPAAATRQLRFYARFIVVCLLLNRKEEALAHLQELQASIAAYVLRFSPGDAAEWQLVAAEAGALMAADVAMPVPRSPGSDIPFKPPMRCRAAGPEASCAPHTPCLREAILAGYHHRQVKIAELPLDLFRMMLLLEWQDRRLVDSSSGCADPAPTASAPQGSHVASGHPAESAQAGSSGSSAAVAQQQQSQLAQQRQAPGDRGLQPSTSGQGSSSHHRNPLKRVMYRPTAQQLIGAVATATASMHDEQQLLLLYLAADALQPIASSTAAGSASNGTSHQPHTPQTAERLLQLSPAAQQHHASAGPGSSRTPAGAAAGAQLGQLHAGGRRPQDGLLLPEELLLAARRQLLLVVDSDMSHDFMRLQGRGLGPPMLCLMSPQHVSPALGDPHRQGRLFPMGLSCPVMLICVLCGSLDPSPAALQQLQEVLDQGLMELGQAMVPQLQRRTPSGSGSGGGAGGGGASSAWAPAFADVLTRQVLLRFALMRCALVLHPASEGGRAELLPRCFPPLPSAADADAPALQRLVRRAAAVLSKEALFSSSTSGGGSGSPDAAAAGAAAAAAVAAVLPAEDVGRLGDDGHVVVAHESGADVAASQIEQLHVSM